MNKVKDLHHEAMRLVDEAESARKEGKKSLARERLRQAFDKEHEAANLVSGDHSLEPTRSVLHRSALECGDLRQAERLIAVALSGEPPDEVAEELRDLLEQIYFGAKKAEDVSLNQASLFNAERLFNPRTGFNNKPEAQVMPVTKSKRSLGAAQRLSKSNGKAGSLRKLKAFGLWAGRPEAQDAVQFTQAIRTHMEHGNDAR